MILVIIPTHGENRLYGTAVIMHPAADMVVARFGEQYGMDPWKYLTVFYDLCTQKIRTLPQENTK
jgi:hypothetical protein